MIIDKDQIGSAIDYVFSQEMYIPVTRDDFDKVCPSPEYAVHVTGRSPAEAVKLLQIEVAIACCRRYSGIITYVKGMSLRMRDLDMIYRALPSADRIRQGISFSKPDEGAVEIWLFANN